MNGAEIFGLIKIKVPDAVKEDQTGAVIIPKGLLLEAARYLISPALDFDNLHCITAVERNDNIEIIYTFYSIKKHRGLTLKSRLALNDLNIESLAKFWKSADWLEREIYDLFGVNFLNHPNLKRILNPDEWTVHPLRKDFVNKDFIKKPRY